MRCRSHPNLGPSSGRDCRPSWVVRVRKQTLSSFHDGNCRTNQGWITSSVVLAIGMGDCLSTWLNSSHHPLNQGQTSRIADEFHLSSSSRNFGHVMFIRRSFRTQQRKREHYHRAMNNHFTYPFVSEPSMGFNLQARQSVFSERSVSMHARFIFIFIIIIIIFLLLPKLYFILTLDFLPTPPFVKVIHC